MIIRNPRLIFVFDVAFDKSPDRIQKIVDSSPEAEFYYTDVYRRYIDVVYPDRHICNIHNKKDTHNVESINADLRHYIPVLARRNRCFAKSLKTLKAVISVFVDAYNRFDLAKYKYRQRKKDSELPFSVIDFLSLRY